MKCPTPEELHELHAAYTSGDATAGQVQDTVSAFPALADEMERLRKVEAVAKRIVRDAPETDSETLRRNRVSVSWTNNAQQVEDLRAALARGGDS